MQISGKVRERLEVSPSITADELKELVLSNEAVQKALDGAQIKTVIVREPKLVNIVPSA